MNEIQCIRTLEDEFAHMAHVEDTGVISNGMVFVVNAGIRDRHVIAGEFGHLGAEGDVLCGKGSRFHMSIKYGCKNKALKVENRK